MGEGSHKEQVRAVWKATAWLTIITIVEVVAALLWIEFVEPGTSKWLLNTFFIAASLLKAFFIVAEFMHVKYETRALALTILVPTVMLIWFVVAFMMEGESWKQNKKNDGWWKWSQKETPITYHIQEDEVVSNFETNV